MTFTDPVAVASKALLQTNSRFVPLYIVTSKKTKMNPNKHKQNKHKQNNHE